MTLQKLNFVHREDPNAKHDFPWRYFDREAENLVDDIINAGDEREDGHWHAPDLPAIATDLNTDVDDIKAGVHDCFVYGTPAKLFQWYVNDGFGGKRPRGLICLATDKPALERAEKTLNEKRRML